MHLASSSRGCIPSLAWSIYARNFVEWAQWVFPYVSAHNLTIWKFSSEYCIIFCCAVLYIIPLGEYYHYFLCKVFRIFIIHSWIHINIANIIQDLYFVWNKTSLEYTSCGWVLLTNNNKTPFLQGKVLNFLKLDADLSVINLPFHFTRIHCRPWPVLLFKLCCRTLYFASNFSWNFS